MTTWPFAEQKSIECRWNAMRFRKSTSIEPHEAVPNLEPCIFERAGQPVIGARAAEREQVAAGFEDAESFARPRFVPRLRVDIRFSAEMFSILRRSATSVVQQNPFVAITFFSSSLIRMLTTKRIPLLPHELQAIGRVRDDDVDA